MLIDGSPVRAPEPLAGLEQDPGAPGGVAHAPASVAPPSATVGHDSATVVNAYIAPTHGRHLPQMMIATTIVAVLPLGVSLALRTSGLATSACQS